MTDTNLDSGPRTPHLAINHSMWIVIADRTQARILSRDLRSFENVYSFRAPAILDAGLANGTVGRGGAYGAGRHKYEPGMEESRQVELALAHSVSVYLKTGLARRQFAELVLIAPPQMLGELRKALPSAVLKTLVLERDKDMTKLHGKELEQALLEMLPGPDQL